MPKKVKQNKQKYSYVPELEPGYAVLRNIGSVLATGAAIQQHDRELLQSMDSKAAEYWRQNAEELEWENKKEQMRGRSEVVQTSPFVFGAGQIAQSSISAAKEIGEAYEAVRNHDIPDMPKDYGMSDFLKDQWNSFFGEMNTLQAEDAKGYQIRALNDRQLIDAYKRSLDLLDQIDQADGQIQYIDEQLAQTNLTVEQRNQLRAKSSELKSARTKLQVEYDNYADQRKLLEDKVRMYEKSRYIR